MLAAAAIAVTAGMVMHPLVFHRAALSFGFGDAYEGAGTIRRPRPRFMSERRRAGSRGPGGRVRGVRDTATADHVDARNLNDGVAGGIDARGLDVDDADQRLGFRGWREDGNCCISE
jgi:hypothetical protein